MPAGVALDWARWCRSRDFITDEGGEPLREHFERFAGAICAYSFADDTMAPSRAVDSLMTFYREAAVERRHVSPLDIGVERIGHFGFFRDRFEHSLWNDGLQWLLRH